MSPADADQQAEWVRRPERSNMTMLRAMRWMSLTLGRPLSRGVLAGISLYFLLFSPRARAASRDYLRRVLGRPPRLAEQFCLFHSFASCIHDRVYLLNGRFDLFDIRIHGREVLDDAIARGDGVFLMGAHLGSFEVVRAVGRQQPGLRVAMAMYADNARQINAALAAINPAAVQDIVALGQVDSMLQVQARLDEGVLLGVLADRALDAGPTLTLPFLGQPAPFPLSSMRLAAMLKRPVVFMTGLYLGGNRYAIHFEKLADFSQVERAGRDAAIRKAVSDYAACLERHCRAAPYNWFNFFDFWRTPGDAGSTAP
jgi:predicted LPLAT superfamily acyltransferase